MLPTIRRLSYMFVVVALLSLGILRLVYHGSCTDLGFGLGAGSARVPCSFWRFFFSPVHLPILVIQAILLLLIVTLYLIRLVLLFWQLLRGD
jgi:hypothetical protein